MRNNLRENVAELLKECRKRAGLSQEELAVRLYVDRTIISKIETRVIKEPSYTLVKEWARVTGCGELVAMHLSDGRDGWKKLTALENAARQAKAALDLVNFMRKQKENTHAPAAQVRSRL